MCPSRLGKQLVPQQLPSPTSFAESEVLCSLGHHEVPCRAHDGGRPHGPPSPGSVGAPRTWGALTPAVWAFYSVRRNSLDTRWVFSNSILLCH